MLRIVAALLFFLHGTARRRAARARPLLWPVAFVLAAEMPVAHFIAQAPKGLYPIATAQQGLTTTRFAA